jgi:hypothetical protein
VIPDLAASDWVVLSSSGGKDSQAMLDFVVEQADRVHVPRSRLLLAHADLGRVEWPGTRELAEEQARHYGLAFVAVRRPQGDLLEHVEQRGMFPSPTARYCTANHKRGQVFKILTRLAEQTRRAGSPVCRIPEGDDGLPRLFVEPVGGDGRQSRPGGRTLLRKTSAKLRVPVRSADRRQVSSKAASDRGFGQLSPTGFEPVTFGSGGYPKLPAQTTVKTS